MSPYTLAQALAGEDGGELVGIWLEGCRAAFKRMLGEKQVNSREHPSHIPAAYPHVKLDSWHQSYLPPRWPTQRMPCP